MLSIAPDSLKSMFIGLAGPAAVKHMRPHLSWRAVYFSGTRYDFREAWDAASSLGKYYAGHLSEYMVRTTLLRFVRDKWDVIVAIGDALLAAPERMLIYEQCVEIAEPALAR